MWSDAHKSVQDVKTLMMLSMLGCCLTAISKQESVCSYFSGHDLSLTGIDIADVSYFVHPDNAMDSEAASRGTTVYLVDKRIDMLPALLGTNLCSLRPYVERLAFSAIWELTPDADVVNVRFTKSVIASKEAFTYEEAQIRKDDPYVKFQLARACITSKLVDIDKMTSHNQSAS